MYKRKIKQDYQEYKDGRISQEEYLAREKKNEAEIAKWKEMGVKD